MVTGLHLGEDGSIKDYVCSMISKLTRPDELLRHQRLLRNVVLATTVRHLKARRLHVKIVQDPRGTSTGLVRASATCPAFSTTLVVKAVGTDG